MDPDWVSAWADVFASIGTVGAFTVGGFLLMKEIGRDRTRVDETQRLQPAAVHAWVEILDDFDVPDAARDKAWAYYEQGPAVQSSDGGPESVSFDTDAMLPFGGPQLESPWNENEKPRSFRIEVINRSNGPLFDVFVEHVALFVPKQPGPQTRLREDPSRMVYNRLPEKSVIYVPLLPIGKFELWYTAFIERDDSIAVSSPIALAFTDCFGLVWSRGRTGSVEQILDGHLPDWASGYTVGTYGHHTSD